MNRSDAPPASTVNKITWSRYVTLDSLISLPALAGGASEALMLPPCTVGGNSWWRFGELAYRSEIIFFQRGGGMHIAV